MAFWNILMGLLCFVGGFAACIGVIWWMTNAMDDTDDYYD